MGWESFLRPGEDPSDDFTQHRAQMRHFDDYMGRVESAGITGSFSTGFSYDSGHGTSSNDGPSAISVGGPDVLRTVSGRLPSAAADSEHESFSDQELEPVLEPQRTVVRRFGIDWIPHPGFSDMETGGEQRGGEGPQSWLDGFTINIADFFHTYDYWHDVTTRMVDERRAADFWESQRHAQKQIEDFNQQYPLWPSTSGYQTGGGF